MHIFSLACLNSTDVYMFRNLLSKLFEAKTVAVVESNPYIGRLSSQILAELENMEVPHH